LRSLVEKWNRFLNEKEGAALPFHVYCDMDGVLVDLPRGIAEQAKFDLKKKPHLRNDIMTIIGQKEEWKKFVQKRPEFKKGFDVIDDIISDREDFWTDLPPMEGADQLWSYISQFNPSILSSPWDQASADGKEIWIANNLGFSAEEMTTKVNLTDSKHLFAVQDNGQPNVLIDDMKKYLKPWKIAGGIPIQHTSASSTIAQLENLIQKIGLH
tara:strand:- start:4930 stop:5565 length:636 start_codon:yes stop_codon:yes gene_type:complete